MKLSFAAVFVTALAGCSADRSSIRASGTIEMDEVDVASLVGGRIARLTVQEGDTVRAGDTLVVLDQGEVAAEVRSQIAQSERALAQFRDVQSGPRPSELKIARSEFRAESAEARIAQSDYKRIAALYEAHVAAQGDLDRAAAARDGAVAKRDGAANQVRLLEAGSRQELISAAEKQAESARAQLAGARSRAGELVLLAPIAGVVLLKNFEQGELAGPGVAIVTLGDPERLWMRAYVGTPFMTRLKLGAAAQVQVIGDRRAFNPRVVEISTQPAFTPRASLTEEE